MGGCDISKAIAQGGEGSVFSGRGNFLKAHTGKKTGGCLGFRGGCNGVYTQREIWREVEKKEAGGEGNPSGSSLV
jgi:hypothetical protein